MSKIESPFHIDEEAEFRFTLSLQSNSVNAHSMLDSGDTKERIKYILDSITKDPRFRRTLEMQMLDWKEKHK